MTRIQEIEQEIWNLAWKFKQEFAGVGADWARILICHWKDRAEFSVPDWAVSCGFNHLNDLRPTQDGLFRLMDFSGSDFELVSELSAVAEGDELNQLVNEWNSLIEAERERERERHEMKGDLSPPEREREEQQTKKEITICQV